MNKRKRDNIIVFSLIGICVVFMLIFLTTFDQQKVYTDFNYLPNGSILIDNKATIIYDEGKYHGDDYYGVLGVIRNTSNKKMEYLKVEYTLYDENGKKIDTLYDMTEKLNKNDEWQFIIEYDGNKKVSSYKLTMISFF